MTDRRPPGNGSRAGLEGDSAGNDGTHVWVFPRLRCERPGDVPPDHPGLTGRVMFALAVARSRPRLSYRLSDADGPHAHHWQAWAWECLGCGAVEYDN